MWRRRAFQWVLAASPLLVVLAFALDRSRNQTFDLAGVHARWQGQPERCLACHAREAASLSGAHDVKALGCSSCHLGNPLSLDKDRAHAGLERFPGDFRSLSRTCGRSDCHPKVASRVRDSLMGTARGLLAVDRHVFGESDGLDGTEGFSDLDPYDPHPSPATAHARKLCASCHLGTHHVSAKVRTRGGGCSACHLKRGATSSAHPELRMGVEPGQCTGCHARSGRISLSYYGWHEGEDAARLSHPGGASSTERASRLSDGRIVHRTLGDVHAKAGLGCLDCHTNVGLMGDGKRYAHEEQQVDIACTDCHLPIGELARAWPLDPQEKAERRIADHFDPNGPWRQGQPVPRTARGTPLTMLRQRADGTRWLRTRVDGRELPVREVPDDAAHRMRGHERLACQACHTSWTHQCTGCHTRRDADGRQWDSVLGGKTAGRWVEMPGDVRIDRPTLGVDDQDTIRPFLPGMPLCIEQEGGERCRRFFAPTDSHTTQREARPCESCHNDSLALGLGRGDVTGEPGAWRFIPDPPPASARDAMPPWEDGVPWDGWTTLEGTEAALATRPGSRPLNPEEMARVLRVGACARCHPSYDDAVYEDFDRSLRRLAQGLAPRCTAPRAWGAEDGPGARGTGTRGSGARGSGARGSGARGSGKHAPEEP